METNKTEKVAMKVPLCYLCVPAMWLIQEVKKKFLTLSLAFVVCPHSSVACLLPFYQLVLLSLRRLNMRFLKQIYNDLSVEIMALKRTSLKPVTEVQ